MGLVNSGATLAKLVNETFTGDDLPFFHTFVDDFLCVSRTFDEHIEKLQIMARKLHEAGLAISDKKSEFCMQRLRWLGQVLDVNGISVDPEEYKRSFNNDHQQRIKKYAVLLGSRAGTDVLSKAILK